MPPPHDGISVGEVCHVPCTFAWACVAGAHNTKVAIKAATMSVFKLEMYFPLFSGKKFLCDVRMRL